ncbi:translation initiation factor IF-2-like [Sciurus carolinensis]|uniref:translation initiation factor IF-2-like n=1 Tax=Sciurus carolinensis TaxID=30640 RepID=UPI001FB44665|nr:translation initiation factor IF-2-like [Sciurus carolinensis]
MGRGAAGSREPGGGRRRGAGPGREALPARASRPRPRRPGPAQQRGTARGRGGGGSAVDTPRPRPGPAPRSPRPAGAAAPPRLSEGRAARDLRDPGAAPRPDRLPLALLRPSRPPGRCRRRSSSSLSPWLGLSPHFSPRACTPNSARPREKTGSLAIHQMGNAKGAAAGAPGLAPRGPFVLREADNGRHSQTASHGSVPVKGRPAPHCGLCAAPRGGRAARAPTHIPRPPGDAALPDRVPRNRREAAGRESCGRVPASPDHALGTPRGGRVH